MELTKNQIKVTKGVAIIFMLLLHLFCTKEYEGLFESLIFIGETPLIYYFALFGDCCVAIYCFCSGYGLFLKYKKDKSSYIKGNLERIIKLYINYWIILILFVVILGNLMNKVETYPGSIKTFLLNFTAISTTYNGAWWFLTTYIILVLISPFINKLIFKFNYKLLLGVTVIIYIIAYIQRIKGVITIDNVIIDWSIRQLSLLGTSLLPFIIGGVFAYKETYSKLYNKVKDISSKNILGILIVSLMIIFHGMVQTLFIAPFTGVIFICVFNLMDKPKWLNYILNFISNHSKILYLYLNIQYLYSYG